MKNEISRVMRYPKECSCHEDCRHWCADTTSCDYILDTGECRGCPADENCVRYAPGKEKRKNGTR